MFQEKSSFHNIFLSVAVVSENEPVGSFVIWVKVTDDDFDQNSEIDVKIEPEEIFQMNSEDGVIITKKTFDREAMDVYNAVPSKVMEGGTR